MSIETGIVTLLEDDNAVSNLVSARIYPFVLPQRPTYPAITYLKVSGQRMWDMSGPSGRGLPRVEVNAWSETASEARSLAAAIRGVLDGHRGVAGGVTIGRLRLDNEREFFEDEARVYRVIMDFEVSHTET